jgi:TPR repeat protein
LDIKAYGAIDLFFYIHDQRRQKHGWGSTARLTGKTMKIFRRSTRAVWACAVVSAALLAGAKAWADSTAEQTVALQAKAMAGDQAALATLMAQAQQGNKYAQNDLGVLYDKGQGVAQDYGQAAQWYRKAAEQGDTRAQNGLGGLYANGQGVPRNKVAAYALYNLSATLDASSGNPALDNRASLSSQMTHQESEAGELLTEKMSIPGHLLQALDEYTAASVSGNP